MPCVPPNVFRRFDPRALVIFYLCFSLAAMYVADLRILAGMAALATVMSGAARLTFTKARRAWITLAVVILVFAGINLLIGRGWVFALSQALRLLGIFMVTLVVAKGIDPANYGVAFRKLGAPDKLAFAITLMMRFVPTLSRDFQIAIDAQRARGFELDPGRGSLVERAKRYSPLFVPVIVRSVIDSEDVANAMDLRAFAAHKRTWLRDLEFRPHDVALIALGVALLAGLIAMSWLGWNQPWLPDWTPP